MRPTFEPVAVESANASEPGTPTLLEAVLSTAECDALLGRAEALGFAPTGKAYPARYRDNDRGVFDDAGLAAWLFARVRARLPPWLPGRSGAPLLLRHLNPRFRVCRYRHGQAFTVHQDGAYAPSREERSRLTLQISLSTPDAFRGGATRFFAARDGALTAAFRPRRGSALLFAHDVWHDGEAVSDGTKVVLRTDVVYDDEPDDAEAPGVLGGHRGYVFDALPLPDGRIATGARDKTIRIFGPGLGPRSLGARPTHGVVAHTASVTCLATDGRRLFAGSRDGTVVGAALDDLSFRVEMALDAAILSLDALPDGGGFVASTADGRLVDSRGGTARLHDGWVWKVVALADRTRLSVGEDGTVARSDDAGGVLARRALAHGTGARSLAVCADGVVVVGLADGRVVWLDGASPTLRPLRTQSSHTHAVTSVAPLDLDGSGSAEAVATAGEDGRVFIFGRDGALLRAFVRPCFVRAIRPLGAHGSLLIAGDDGRVVMLDARDGIDLPS